MAARRIAMTAAELVDDPPRHALAGGCGCLRVALGEEGGEVVLLLEDEGCTPWFRIGGGTGWGYRRTGDPALRERILHHKRSDLIASSVVLDALIRLPVR